MRVLGAAAVALSLMISGAGAAGPDTLDQFFSGALKIGNTTITVNGIVAPANNWLDGQRNYCPGPELFV